MKAVLVAIFACCAMPAMAAGSLGITGAGVSLGMMNDEAGASRVEGAAVVDVAITDVHGFQGDLRFADTVAGGIGAVGAHLYMAPRDGQKYGLFAAVSDVDGRALTWVSLGAEAMFALDRDTSIEAQAGIGSATDGGLDYIFGGFALNHAVSSAFDLSASVDLADFDEPGLRAISYDAGLVATYSPEGAPWEVFARISHAGLSGRDGAAGATRIGLGVTLTLGTPRGTDPRTRPFRSVDPVAPLLRRDLW